MSRAVLGIGRGVLLLAAWGSLSGCTERLMRENVFANTETGVGLFVAQNAKSQSYEAKLGYLRHELFFVPTSKTIIYDTGWPTSLWGVLIGGNQIEKHVEETDPTRTPEVLAEIATGASASGGSDGQSFSVRQRLAVGDEAVSGASALALMTDSAEEARAVVEALSIRNEKQAEQASVAVALISTIALHIDDLARDFQDAEAKRVRDRLEAAAPALITLESQTIPKLYSYNFATKTLGARDVPSGDRLPSPPGFLDVAAHWSRWGDSRRALRYALSNLSDASFQIDLDTTDATPAVVPPDKAALEADLTAKYETYDRVWKDLYRALRQSPAVKAAIRFYLPYIQEADNG